MNTHVEHVQRNFTETELLEFGKRHASLVGEVEALEDGKKSAMDDFKSQISKRVKESSELAEKVRLGYEIVPTPCDVVMNQPTRGMKTLINKKTLEIVKVLPMTGEDNQSSLFDE